MNLNNLLLNLCHLFLLFEIYLYNFLVYCLDVFDNMILCSLLWNLDVVEGLFLIFEIGLDFLGIGDIDLIWIFANLKIVFFKKNKTI